MPDIAPACHDRGVQARVDEDVSAGKELEREVAALAERNRSLQQLVADLTQQKQEEARRHLCELQALRQSETSPQAALRSQHGLEVSALVRAHSLSSAGQSREPGAEVGRGQTAGEAACTHEGSSQLFSESVGSRGGAGAGAGAGWAQVEGIMRERDEAVDLLLHRCGMHCTLKHACSLHRCVTPQSELNPEP